MRDVGWGWEGKKGEGEEREREQNWEITRVLKSSMGSKVNVSELNMVPSHLCKGKIYPSFFFWFKSLG